MALCWNHSFYNFHQMNQPIQNIPRFIIIRMAVITEFFPCSFSLTISCVQKKNSSRLILATSGQHVLFFYWFILKCISRSVACVFREFSLWEFSYVMTIILCLIKSNWVKKKWFSAAIPRCFLSEHLLVLSELACSSYFFHVDL